MQIDLGKASFCWTWNVVEQLRWVVYIFCDNSTFTSSAEHAMIRMESERFSLLLNMSTRSVDSVRHKRHISSRLTYKRFTGSRNMLSFVPITFCSKLWVFYTLLQQTNPSVVLLKLHRYFIYFDWGFLNAATKYTIYRFTDDRSGKTKCFLDQKC